MDEQEKNIVDWLEKNLLGYKHDPAYKTEDWVHKWIPKSEWPKYKLKGWVLTFLEGVDNVRIRKRKH